jgi:hypothetical protein
MISWRFIISAVWYLVSQFGCVAGWVGCRLGRLWVGQVTSQVGGMSCHGLGGSQVGGASCCELGRSQVGHVALQVGHVTSQVGCVRGWVVCMSIVEEI